MLALQCPTLKHLLLVQPRNGLGDINQFQKRKHLGAGGGQLCLRRDQGGCRGLLMPLRLS